MKFSVISTFLTVAFFSTWSNGKMFVVHISSIMIQYGVLKEIRHNKNNNVCIALDLCKHHVHFLWQRFLSVNPVVSYRKPFPADQNIVRIKVSYTLSTKFWSIIQRLHAFRYFRVFLLSFPAEILKAQHVLFEIQLAWFWTIGLLGSWDMWYYTKTHTVSKEHELFLFRIFIVLQNRKFKQWLYSRELCRRILLGEVKYSLCRPHQLNGNTLLLQC